MVQAHLGVPKTEADLRDLCDCTIFGTSALELVLAVRRLGFAASSKYKLTLVDLIELTEQGYFPIVYVVLVPIRPRPMFTRSSSSPRHLNT